MAAGFTVNLVDRMGAADYKFSLSLAVGFYYCEVDGLVTCSKSLFGLRLLLVFEPIRVYIKLVEAPESALEVLFLALS